MSTSSSVLRAAITLNLHDAETVSTDSGVGHAMVEVTIADNVLAITNESITDKVLAVAIEAADTLGSRYAKAKRKAGVMDAVKQWHNLAVKSADNYTDLVYPPKGTDAFNGNWITTKAPNKTHLNGSFVIGKSVSSILAKVVLVYTHKGLAVLKKCQADGTLYDTCDKIREANRPKTALDSIRDVFKLVTGAEQNWVKLEDMDADILIELKAMAERLLVAGKLAEVVSAKAA